MLKFTKEELNIIHNYEHLALLNMKYGGGVETNADIETYVFVKIMFEHPLADGNKRLAIKYLMNWLKADFMHNKKYKHNLSPEKLIDKWTETICKSLAKEIR